MINVTIDSRDGISSMGSGSCAVCCCQPVTMRPGETNLMALNYAPWSVPLGGLGIVETTEFDIVRDSSACSTAAVDGFAPPSNSNYAFATALNTLVAIDLSTNATPVLNTFTYEVVQFSGPKSGALVLNSTTGVGSYTPNTGFVGWDTFQYRMTDAQGRTTVRTVTINVGAVPGAAPSIPVGLQIPRSQVIVDQRMQVVTFAMTLGEDVQPCEVFKVTVKQPARDCSRLFANISCFEVHVGKC